MVSKSAKRTQKKTTVSVAKKPAPKKLVTKAVKPTVKAPVSKSVVKPAPAKVKNGGKRGFSIFPASWDINEQRQFVSFLIGMILAGFVMWGYVVLDNHWKEERQREQMEAGFLRAQWIRAHAPKGHHGKPMVVPSCGAIVPRKAAFNPAEYAPYAAKGSLNLSGSVCDGLPKGAECPPRVMVFVNPVTGYSTEWYTRHWVKNERLSDPDQRAWQFQRRSVSADKGAFVLKDLPAGSYYVGANLCVKMKPTDPGCTPVRLGAKVALKGNEKVALKPVFTGRMLPPPPPCGCGKGNCPHKRK